MMDKKMKTMMAIVPDIGLDYVPISLLLFIKRWYEFRTKPIILPYERRAFLRALGALMSYTI